MADVKDIIKLYRYFHKYDNFTDDEIYQNILPSLKLKQYCLHQDKQGLYGFTNWAFLSEQEEQHFLKYKAIRSSQWCSGDIVWHIDTVALGNIPSIINYTKNYFTHLLGVDKKVKWLRIYDDKIIHKEITTKRHFV